MIAARDLAAADTQMVGSGKSDPYALVYWGGRKVGETAVVQNDLNPRWDQSFQVVKEGSVGARGESVDGGELRIEVHDKDSVGGLPDRAGRR